MRLAVKHLEWSETKTSSTNICRMDNYYQEFVEVLILCKFKNEY